MPLLGTAAAVLHVEGLGVLTREGKPLLQDIGFTISAGEFVAIIGPSGCGKSTLLKALAAGQGSEGSIRVAGRDPSRGVGYLPQRSTLHEQLTLREILDFALRLRTRTKAGEYASRISSLLEMCGIEALQQQTAGSLSGGQQRRAALAELMTSDPDLLFLDELTSGLDPHADREIMQVLCELAHASGKTILLVTHSVRNLELCDRVLMLKAGCLVHDGSPDTLLQAANAADIEDLYALPLSSHPVPQGRSSLESATHLSSPVAPRQSSGPGFASQVFALARRQWLLFSRDKGQLALHLALILTFPLLVVLFAAEGLPLVRSLPLQLFGANPMEAIGQQAQWKESSFRAGTLVSGLTMFQVILLTLMGANNGAREIARERDINEKEFASGLKKSAYVAQKAFFVGALSTVQGLWMAWLVQQVCGFPGSLGEKAAVLILTTFAVSSICLAISAASANPERASLLSLYLVGFQLPLSGAVLALPEWARWICQPFISAYWGWSGYLRSLIDSPYYDVVSQITNTGIANFDLSIVVLTIHIGCGLAGAGGLLARHSFQTAGEKRPR